ncbi:MAG: ABC transporter substrate-binding protein [Rhodospirillaceae bacterium]|nr:MAG: ABC transporter substrate-binding protein [Rhodospirillaceae bacterium]
MVSRRQFLGTAGSLSALALLKAKWARAAGSDLVFTSWGGTTQEAQMNAWAKPLAEKSGINVVQDGPTDYGKLKAMIDSGNVTWDVVDVEQDYGVWAGAAGQLEPLDFSIIKRDEIDPRFVTDYAVGSFFYAYVLGYNSQTYGDRKPATWADLFDLKKFPGKRTFYKWSAPGNLEIPLLADGVKPEELYPLDIDRALKKLDTIKQQIVWWSTGAQSQQLLASGETPMGMMWNGRVAALLQDGAPVDMTWEQNLTAADLLVVPKGTKNKEAAMRFLAYAVSPEGQAEMAKLSGYAPTNIHSADLLDEKIRKTLPDQYKSQNVPMDINYWAQHRDEIAKRWYDWQVA